jgi:hypothetical protein
MPTVRDTREVRIFKTRVDPRRKILDESPETRLRTVSRTMDTPIFDLTGKK